MDKLTKYLLIVLGVCITATTIYIFKLQSANITNSTPTPTATITPSPQEEMTFMLAGDAMFGRAVYYQFHENLTDAFQNLGQGFFQGDITLLNLEGPIVNKEFTPDVTPDNLIMKFPPQTKDALTWIGINTVGLANNHTDNQGESTLQFTREILNNTQIETIGDPKNENNIVKTFQKGNQKTSIIALNILANSTDISEIIKEQKNARAFVIIFPHWGSEYQTTHNTSQEKLAHQWIDQGADLIVGSHPHVIQDTELYLEKPIIYSLGNFLFDQTFSQNTQRGLVLKGKINKNKLTLEFLPVKSVHLRLELLEGEEKEKIVEPLKKSLGLK